MACRTSGTIDAGSTVVRTTMPAFRSPIWSHCSYTRYTAGFVSASTPLSGIGFTTPTIVYQ